MKTATTDAKSTEWIKGEPQRAGWYLAAVRTNDSEARYWVIQLWFNPESLVRWFVGGGYVNDKCEPYRYRERIVAHRPVPQFATALFSDECPTPAR